MARFVFDTGALISAERRKQRATDFIEDAKRGRFQIVTPVVCILEWWRGRSDVREDLLTTITVQPLLVSTAKVAGEALARLGGHIDARRTIDAAVAAHAAVSGAGVVTSDPDDFEALRAYFRGLRVFAL